MCCVASTYQMVQRHKMHSSRRNVSSSGVNDIFIYIFFHVSYLSTYLYSLNYSMPIFSYFWIIASAIQIISLLESITSTVILIATDEFFKRETFWEWFFAVPCAFCVPLCCVHVLYMLLIVFFHLHFSWQCGSTWEQWCGHQALPARVCSGWTPWTVGTLHTLCRREGVLFRCGHCGSCSSFSLCDCCDVSRMSRWLWVRCAFVAFKMEYAMRYTPKRGRT